MNKYAVSAEDVGAALTRSASALNLAGNTIQETAAMVVGITEVTQDPEKAGSSLKVLSLRLRGMKGELQELGEEVDENVESLSKMQTQILNLTHGKVNIFNDDGSFKSTYEIMSDIAGIWKDLSSTEQADLLETIAGKNRANDIAALIQNWGQVEDAMQTALGAEGSAAIENEKRMKSIQGRIDSLAASWQTLSTSLIDTDFIKVLISSLTAILDILNSIVKTFGGLGTIGAGFVIFEIFKHKNYFSTAISLLNEMGWSMGNLGDIAKMAGKDLLSFIKTPAGIASAVSLAVAGISLIVNAINNYRQKQREAWQEQVDSANEYLESTESFDEAYSKIVKYANKTSLTAAEQEDFAASVEIVNKALGNEAGAFDATNMSASEYLETLQGITEEQLKQNRNNALQGKLSAANLLKDASLTGINDSTVVLTLFNPIDKFLSENVPNITSNVFEFSPGRNPTSAKLSPSDYRDVDSIADYYLQLLKIQDLLLENFSFEELEGNKTYKRINSVISNLKEPAEEYLKWYYQELITTYEEIYDIPSNIDEYTNMRQYILDSADGSQLFKDNIIEMLDLDVGKAFDLSTLGKSVDEVVQYSEEQKQRVMDKFKDDSITDWFNSLSEEDKNLVYKLGLESEDTSLWTISRWEQELSHLEEQGITSSESMKNFYDILNNSESGNFTETITGYIDEITELKDALENIEELSDKEIFDLSMKFPELIGKTGDINTFKQALNDLIELYTGKINTEFSGQLESFGEFGVNSSGGKALISLWSMVDSMVSDSSDWDFDIEAQISKFENLSNAAKESVSATGLSAEGIKNIESMFSGLEGYDPSILFEHTANGVHLNTNALRVLQSQYKSTIKLNLQDRLRKLRKEYDDSLKAVDGLTKGTEEYNKALKEQGLRSTDDILEDIKNVENLANQYIGLTSAYNSWIQAQSQGEEGDMYDNITSSMKDVQELYNKGLVGTNEFRAFVQLMTNEDLSTASMEKLVSVYQEGMPTMERYFTETQDGCQRFLEDVNAINSEWAYLNENGNWVINFGIGGDKDVADALSNMTGLEVSTEQIQILLRKLKDYGFEINLDTNLEEALGLVEDYQSAVKELSELEIKGADVSEIDIAKQKVNEYAALIHSLPAEVKTSIGIDPNASIDEIKTQLSSEEISIPATIDTTTATTEIDGSDVSITVTTSGNEAVDNLKSAIDSIESKTVTIRANVSGATQTERLFNSIKKISNKSVTVKAIVNGTTAVEKLVTALNKLNSKVVYATAKVKGTAYANGTAFSNGNWGAKESGTALGGELGRELVVRNGKWFTIGDRSAEFFRYQKGDIIFNAEQTRQIFEKGKITSGNGRGNSYAEGTAFSNGTGGFFLGNISNSGLSSTSGSSSVSNSSNNSNKDFEETFDWIEVAIDRIERAIDSLDLKVNSSYKSWSERNSNLKQEIGSIADEIAIQEAGYNRYLQQANSVGLPADMAELVRNGAIDIDAVENEELAKQIKEFKDWYEKALDCRDAVDELTESLSECYKIAFDNIVAQYDGILAVIGHEKSMLEEYISQTESHGHVLSKDYYRELIRNESEYIDRLNQEKNDLLSSLENGLSSGAIEKGSETWYEMINQIDEVTLAIEQSNTAIIEFSNSIRDIEWQVFDMLQNDISEITKESNFLIDLLGNKNLYKQNGQFTSDGLSTMGLHGQNYNVYMYQADEYAKEISKLNNEISKDPYNQTLIDRRKELLNLQQESILSAESEKDAIVDMVREGIELELDALSELIDTYTDALDSQKDLYEYQKKVAEQTKKIASLEKQMAAYSGDTSEESKAKIQQIKVSLEEARTDLEETEYDKYISDTKQLLDELYIEYETILNERLDNIDALISDMIVSINNNSSEIAYTIYTAAEKVGYSLTERMQSIWQEAYQNSLLENQNRLAEATAIINQLVSNGQLSKQDADRIIATLANGNMQSVQETLDLINQLVLNGQLSQQDADKIVNSLNTSKSAIGNIVTEYNKDFGNKATTINETLLGIKNDIQTMITKSNGDAETKVSSANTSSSSNSSQANTKPVQTTQPPTNVKQNNNSSQKTVPEGRTDKEIYGVALAIWNGNYGWGNGATRKNNLTKKGFDAEKVQNIVNWLGKEGYVYSNAWRGKYYGITDLTPYHFNKFESGTYKINKNQLAWTQEAGREMIVRPSDGAILTPLAKNDSVLNANASKNMWDMANNPSEFIRDNFRVDGVGSNIEKSPNTSYTQNLDKVVFNLPNIKNYDELLNSMKNDKNFERLVLSMTIDRVAGKSQLATGKSIR